MSDLCFKGESVWWIG